MRLGGSGGKNRNASDMEEGQGEMPARGGIEFQWLNDSQRVVIVIA